MRGCLGGRVRWVVVWGCLMSQGVVVGEEVAKKLRAKIFEPDILRLAKCPCRETFGGGAALSRFYIFDTSGEISSGLNHQLSNLKAILSEGLWLGRAILLRRPTLTKEHNFNRDFKYNMWGDFIAFNESTFTMYASGRGALGSGRRRSCSGVMADCIADVSEKQLAELVKVPHAVVGYHNGTVSAEMNAVPGVLIRKPMKDANDKVALVRKLPGFPELFSSTSLRLSLRSPKHVTAAVPPVLAWLRQSAKDPSKIAVVHVRRGDKIQNRKYCPKEMRLATGPHNVAKTLAKAGFPNGSSIYVMSDETDFNHFKPLIDLYDYRVVTNLHFDHLHHLLEGCSYLGYQRGLPCENYLLFAIEKEIMLSVPTHNRIVTIPRHDVAHNPEWLMRDFLGPDKPCKAL